MQNLIKIQTTLRFKDSMSLLTSVLQHFSQFLADFINPVLTGRLNYRNLMTNQEACEAVGPEIFIYEEPENNCCYILASFNV